VRTPIARRALLLLLGSIILPVHGAAAARPGVVEVTETARGRALIAEHAGRPGERGQLVASGKIRAWEIGPGDYFLADRLPLSLRTSLERDPVSGEATRVISFDVEGALRSPRAASTAAASAGGPWWLWLDQYCFKAIDNLYGWMQSCYKLHGMVNEQDSRDFYALEQYGQIGATTRPGAQIYSGFVDAVKATGSATMSWIDWSPRSSVSGSCRSIPISVDALNVVLSATGVMCENWYINRSTTTGGNLRETWSCGCPIGFGVGYPSTREVDYLQLVSVLNGRVPKWTLSQGFHAR
jgi:hypothetical protein